MTDVPTQTTTLFEALGGRDAVARLVDEFYTRIEADERIRPVYPADLAPGRAKLKLFFEQWLGGEAVYSAVYGHPRMRRRHFPFVIEERHAGIWLKHMADAMEATGIVPGTRRVMLEHLGPLAHHMVNANDDVPREPLAEAFLE